MVPGMTSKVRMTWSPEATSQTRLSSREYTTCSPAPEPGGRAAGSSLSRGTLEAMAAEVLPAAVLVGTVAAA